MICYQMPNKPTKPNDQLNLRFPLPLHERLEKMALRYGKRSKSAVAAEIIEQFADFYEQLEEARYRAFEDQRRRLLSNEPIGVQQVQNSVDKESQRRQSEERLVVGEVEAEALPSTPRRKGRTTGTK